MSILESKIDLFGLARFILRDFVLPAISQSILYGIIGTVVFLNAGLVVYYYGVTRLVAFDSSIAAVLTLGFVLTIYALLGLLTVFIGDFLQELRARGERRVTSQTVERFAREQFVRLFIGHAQRQANVTRLIAVAVVVVFLLIPIVAVVV